MSELYPYQINLGAPIIISGLANGQVLTYSSSASAWVNNPSEGDVLSVSNSDGSLTVSPTTGSVVVSLNPAHPNTFTGLQTFGNNISIGGAQYNITSLTSGQYVKYNGTNWSNYTRTSADVVSELGYTPSHMLQTVNDMEITSANTATTVFTQSISSVGNYMVYCYIHKGSASTSTIALTWYNSGGTQYQAYFVNGNDTGNMAADFMLSPMFIHAGSGSIELTATDSSADNLFVSAVLVQL